MFINAQKSVTNTQFLIVIHAQFSLWTLMLKRWNKMLNTVTAISVYWGTKRGSISNAQFPHYLFVLEEIPPRKIYRRIAQYYYIIAKILCYIWIFIEIRTLFEPIPLLATASRFKSLRYRVRFIDRRFIDRFIVYICQYFSHLCLHFFFGFRVI